MHRYIAFLLLLFLTFPAGAQTLDECQSTSVNNSTFIIPDAVAAKAFSGGEVVTVETKDNGICVAYGSAKTSAFALAIRADDPIVAPDSITGATPGEQFVVKVDGQPVSYTLAQATNPLMQTTSTYSNDVVYVADSFEKLASGSSNITFNTDSLYTSVDTASVGLSISLPDTLKGLQFDLSFDGPTPVIEKGYAQGTLQTNLLTPDSMRVLLYSSDGSVFPKTDVLSVLADVTTGGQTLSLSNAYAAVGGSGSTVEVALTEGSPLFIRESFADIVVQTDSLANGQAAVGSVASSGVSVENQGTGPATVSISSSNPLFTASSVEIAAGGLTDIPVAFAPTRTTFGGQSTTLTVTDGTNSSTLPATGFGFGGRGDPTKDGAVSISDVVMTADMILQTITPDSLQLRAGDVYPLETEGDSTVKITDLQTTVGAILNGAWEDGVAIPTASSTTIKSAREDVIVFLKEMEGETEVYIEGTESTRGVQLELDRPISAVDAEGANIRSKTKDGTTRVLIWRPDGSALSSDLLVGTMRGKSDVEVTGVATDDDYVMTPLGSRRQEFVMENNMAVYPNPARGQVNVDVSLKAAGGEVAVYDALGRQVTLLDDDLMKGRTVYTMDTSRLSSGLYFVRIVADGIVRTRKLTVVR